MRKRHNTPGWQVQLEQRVYSLRRRLLLIDVILKCRTTKVYDPSEKH